MAEHVTRNRPARTMATFNISDSFDGDFEVKVTDEPAIPTTTDERRFVVRVRNDEIETEWADAPAAMARALWLAGWDQTVKEHLA